jgi:hypothetical protein
MLTISIIDGPGGRGTVSNGPDQTVLPDVNIWGDTTRLHSHYIAWHMRWIWVCDNDHLVRLEPESLTPSAIFFSARCKTMDYVKETDGGLMVLSQSGTFYVNYLGEFHLLKAALPIQAAGNLPITIQQPMVYWHNAKGVCMETNLDNGNMTPAAFPGVTSKSISVG